MQQKPISIARSTPFKRAHRFVVGAAASLLLSGAALASGTAAWSLQKRDLNKDGVADAYYDSVLKVTWLANPTLWGTGPVFKNWVTAKQWVANFSVGGIGGWRLPKIDPDACEWYWQGEICAKGANGKKAELLHLWHVTLGGLNGAYHPLRGLAGLNDGNWYDQPGPVSFPNSAYGSFFPQPAYAQPYSIQTTLFAWPVKDGDVGTPLP